MKYTPFEILNYPTKDVKIAFATFGSAIDITYKCPECGKERAVTWLFPEEDMIYQDECCGEVVHFKGEGEEE